MKLITRKEYMEKNNREDAYREFYGQFVTEGVKKLVKTIGIKKIIDSEDEFFNDIELSKFDKLATFLPVNVLRQISEANGGDGVSLSDKVCTLKEAASQIREEAKK